MDRSTGRCLESGLRSRIEPGEALVLERDSVFPCGGKRARVSQLGTLLSSPCTLLFGELFSRLDSNLREKFRLLTRQSTMALPVLLVTHDLSEVPQGASIGDIGSATPTVKEH